MIIELIDIGPRESVAVGLRIDSHDSDPRDGNGNEASDLFNPGAEIDDSITVQAAVSGPFDADTNEFSVDSDNLEAK